jgi:formamidopyrimidine-DNA glycosylase
MPELPDVAQFEKMMSEDVLGRTVEKTSVLDERILEEGLTAQSLGRRLKSRTLKKTHRHGKYLLVRAGDAGWLVLHFGMTGEPVVYAKDEAAPDYARLIIDFKDGGHFAVVWKRMLGELGFAESVAEFVNKQELGPDALSEDMDGDAFHELFKGRNGMIKSLLMDQSILAGIGNVYSDEILFQSGVHPKRRADDVDEKEYKTLFRAMRRVLETALRHEANPKKFPKRYLLRSAEEGGKCPKCEDKITKVKVSGRSARVCEKCQK